MIRLLVIGAGLIGSRHVQTIAANPGCELVGVVDPDTAKPSPKAEPYNTLYK